MKPRYYIGIDPGTKTGVAVWDVQRQCFTTISSKKVYEAFEYIKSSFTDLSELVLRVENPNLRKWFGNSGREKLQGAGSIKRDFAIWKEFCEYHGIEMKEVAPKNIRTKVSSDYFKRLTGWEGRTSEHARDAAMMVYGMRV